MSSNGLLNRAITGTCRICQRSRKTDIYLKSVGEVRRGYATGHIWECIDNCDEVANKRLHNYKLSGNVRAKIKIGLERGPLLQYTVIT